MALQSAKKWPSSLPAIDIPQCSKVYHPCPGQPSLIDVEILRSCDPRYGDVPESSIYFRKPEPTTVEAHVSKVNNTNNDYFDNKQDDYAASSMQNSASQHYMKSDGELSNSGDDNNYQRTTLNSSRHSHYQTKHHTGQRSKASHAALKTGHRAALMQGFKRKHSEDEEVRHTMASKKKSANTTSIRTALSSKSHKRHHAERIESICNLKTLTPFVEFIPNLDDPLLEITLCEVEDLCAMQRQDFLSDLNSVFLGRKARFLFMPGRDKLHKHIAMLSPATQFDGYCISNERVNHTLMQMLMKWLRDKPLDKVSCSLRPNAHVPFHFSALNQPFSQVVDHMNEAFCSWLSKQLTELYVITSGDIEVCYDIFVGSSIPCQCAANQLYRQVKQYLTNIQANTYGLCRRPPSRKSDSFDVRSNVCSKKTPVKPSQSVHENLTQNLVPSGNRTKVAVSNVKLVEQTNEQLERTVIKKKKQAATQSSLPVETSKPTTRKTTVSSGREKNNTITKTVDLTEDDMGSIDTLMVVDDVSSNSNNTLFKPHRVNVKHIRQKKKRSHKTKSHTSKKAKTSKKDKKANDSKSKKASKPVITIESKVIKVTSFSRFAGASMRIGDVPGSDHVSDVMKEISNVESSIDVITPSTLKTADSVDAKYPNAHNKVVQKGGNLVSLQTESVVTARSDSQTVAKETEVAQSSSEHKRPTSTETVSVTAGVSAKSMAESLAVANQETVSSELQILNSDASALAITPSTTEQVGKITGHRCGLLDDDSESIELIYSDEDDVEAMQQQETRDISKEPSADDLMEAAAIVDKCPVNINDDSSDVCVRLCAEQVVAYSDSSISCVDGEGYESQDSFNQEAHSWLTAEKRPNEENAVSPAAKKAKFTNEVEDKLLDFEDGKLQEESDAGREKLVAQLKDIMAKKAAIDIPSHGIFAKKLPIALAPPEKLVAQLKDIMAKKGAADIPSPVKMMPQRAAVENSSDAAPKKATTDVQPLTKIVTSVVPSATINFTAVSHMPQEAAVDITSAQVMGKNATSDTLAAGMAVQKQVADMVPAPIVAKLVTTTEVVTKKATTDMPANNLVTVRAVSTVSSAAIDIQKPVIDIPGKNLSDQSNAEDGEEEEEEEMETVVHAFEPKPNLYFDSFLSKTEDPFSVSPLPNFEPAFDPTMAPVGCHPFHSVWPVLDAFVKGDVEQLQRLTSLPDVNLFSSRFINRNTSFLWAMSLSVFSQKVDKTEVDKVSSEESLQDANGQQSGLSAAAAAFLSKANASRAAKTANNPLMQAFRQAVEAKRKIAMKPPLGFTKLLAKQESALTSKSVEDSSKNGGLLSATAGPQQQNDDLNSNNKLMDVVSSAMDGFYTDLSSEFSFSPNVDSEFLAGDAVKDLQHLAGLSESAVNLYESLDLDKFMPCVVQENIPTVEPKPLLPVSSSMTMSAPPLPPLDLCQPFVCTASSSGDIFMGVNTTPGKSTVTDISAVSSPTISTLSSSDSSSAVPKTVAAMLPPPMPPLALSDFTPSVVGTESQWSSLSTSATSATTSANMTAWETTNSTALFSFPVDQLVQFPPPLTVPPPGLAPLSGPPTGVPPPVLPPVGVPPPNVPPLSIPPPNIPPPTITPLAMQYPPPSVYFCQTSVQSYQTPTTVQSATQWAGPGTVITCSTDQSNMHWNQSSVSISSSTSLPFNGNKTVISQSGTFVPANQLSSVGGPFTLAANPRGSLLTTCQASTTWRSPMVPVAATPRGPLQTTSQKDEKSSMLTSSVSQQDAWRSPAPVNQGAASTRLSFLNQREPCPMTGHTNVGRSPLVLSNSGMALGNREGQHPAPRESFISSDQLSTPRSRLIAENQSSSTSQTSRIVADQKPPAAKIPSLLDAIIRPTAQFASKGMSSSPVSTNQKTPVPGQGLPGGQSTPVRGQGPDDKTHKVQRGVQGQQPPPGGLPLVANQRQKLPSTPVSNQGSTNQSFGATASVPPSVRGLSVGQLLAGLRSDASNSQNSQSSEPSSTGNQTNTVSVSVSLPTTPKGLPAQTLTGLCPNNPQSQGEVARGSVKAESQAAGSATKVHMTTQPSQTTDNIQPVSAGQPLAAVSPLPTARPPLSLRTQAPKGWGFSFMGKPSESTRPVLPLPGLGNAPRTPLPVSDQPNSNSPVNIKVTGTCSNQPTSIQDTVLTQTKLTTVTATVNSSAISSADRVMTSCVSITSVKESQVMSSAANDVDVTTLSGSVQSVPYTRRTPVIGTTSVSFNRTLPKPKADASSSNILANFIPPCQFGTASSKSVLPSALKAQIASITTSSTETPSNSSSQSTVSAADSVVTTALLSSQSTVSSCTRTLSVPPPAVVLSSCPANSVKPVQSNNASHMTPIAQHSSPVVPVRATLQSTPLRPVSEMASMISTQNTPGIQVRAVTDHGPRQPATLQITPVSLVKSMVQMENTAIAVKSPQSAPGNQVRGTTGSGPRPVAALQRASGIQVRPTSSTAMPVTQIQPTSVAGSEHRPEMAPQSSPIAQVRTTLHTTLGRQVRPMVQPANKPQTTPGSQPRASTDIQPQPVSIIQHAPGIQARPTLINTPASRVQPTTKVGSEPRPVMAPQSSSVVTQMVPVIPTQTTPRGQVRATTVTQSGPRPVAAPHRLPSVQTTPSSQGRPANTSQTGSMPVSEISPQASPVNHVRPTMEADNGPSPVIPNQHVPAMQVRSLLHTTPVAQVRLATQSGITPRPLGEPQSLPVVKVRSTLQTIAMSSAATRPQVSSQPTSSSQVTTALLIATHAAAVTVNQVRLVAPTNESPRSHSTPVVSLADSEIQTQNSPVACVTAPAGLTPRPVMTPCTASSPQTASHVTPARGGPPLTRTPVASVTANVTQLGNRLQTNVRSATPAGSARMPVVRLQSMPVRTAVGTTLQPQVTPQTAVRASFSLLSPNTTTRIFMFRASDVPASKDVQTYLESRKAKLFDPYNIVTLCHMDKVECRIMVQRDSVQYIHQIPNLLRLKRHLVVSFVIYNTLSDVVANRVSFIFPRGGLLIIDTASLVTCQPVVLDTICQFVKSKGSVWRILLADNVFAKLQLTRERNSTSAQLSTQLGNIINILTDYRTQGFIEFMPTDIYGGQPSSSFEYWSLCVKLETTRCFEFRHFLYITDMSRTHHDAKMFMENGIDVMNVAEFVRGFMAKNVEHRPQPFNVISGTLTRATSLKYVDARLSLGNDNINM